MVLPNGFVVVRERARPLAPDERREAILDAVLPLLRDRGRDVTSRELAEAAGVAEGTIFRAFGDKDTLLEAGLIRLLAPEGFREELRRIPHDLPLEDKVTCVIEALRTRFGEVFRIMAVFGVDGPPPVRDAGGGEWISILHELFASDADRLAVPLETLAWYLRLVAFGGSIEPFNHFRPFDSAELATVVVHGVAVTGAPVPPPPTRPARSAAAARPSHAA
ncbi:TetR/AcrR family transcriptional regulator [Protaetiibacter sp. SSC-01]|uniref:TetR/AcrR family transcriptional regulator n=1 Tax=Protaetiibacter sp. SSC-01 TaxID=2759943 RepID=UPI00223A9D45|nr:helix-turn-helix domain-containing protein [Protaetiibacter sp. SSC-01]